MTETAGQERLDSKCLGITNHLFELCMSQALGKMTSVFVQSTRRSRRYHITLIGTVLNTRHILGARTNS